MEFKRNSLFPKVSWRVIKVHLTLYGLITATLKYSARKLYISFDRAREGEKGKKEHALPYIL
jgi:hypothetical protein